MNNKGLLIQVEGISCAGKTTLVNYLVSNINKEVIPLGGYNVRKYSTELTKICNKLMRKKPFFDLSIIIELNLFISEILYDIEKNVIPNLESGKLVLYDNYWDSIFIIESILAKIRYDDSNQINKLTNYINTIKKLTEDVTFIPKADLLIIVETDIYNTVSRIKKREDIDELQEFIKVQTELKQKISDISCSKKYVIKNNGSLDDYYSEILKLSKYINEKVINQ